MKKIIILLLLTLSIQADSNSTYERLFSEFKESNTTDSLYKLGSSYLQSINTPVNRDKAKKLYKESTDKMSKLAVNALIEIYCSKEENPQKNKECIYWSNRAEESTLKVETLQKATYLLEITKKSSERGIGSAVAISKNGKLVTAYHNVDSIKSVVAIDHRGEEYNVTLGEISASDDLAYLYINDKSVSFVEEGSADLELGERVYVLNAEGLLLQGMVSQTLKNEILLNIEITKGTSGGGVFNSKNELVAIALSKSYLDKTSNVVSIRAFKEIKDPYVPKNELLNIGSNNYDTKYCEDEHDLEIWKRNEKSKSLEVQELHALFIGLCQKVKNRDLTTDAGQLIFEERREQLLSK